MVTPEEARKIASTLVDYPYERFSTSAAIDALRDLASQVESLQADAERYRFIKENLSEACVIGLGYVMEFEDAAIDEARKQS